MAKVRPEVLNQQAGGGEKRAMESAWHMQRKPEQAPAGPGRVVCISFARVIKRMCRNSDAASHGKASRKLGKGIMQQLSSPRGSPRPSGRRPSSHANRASAGPAGVEIL